MYSFTSVRAGVLLSLAVLLWLPSRAQPQGIALTGVGPVTRSMGGAATANPLDAAGAIHWNPAAISGLPASEVTVGMELILPSSTLSSRIDAGALGGGFPPVDMAGSSRSEPGVSPVPTIAFVHKPACSPWTYGLGIFGVAGFSDNYPASLTNPILTPQPPLGVGLGRIATSVEIMQLVPTVSRVLTEKLSIGFAPTITLARLHADPLCLAAPDDANGDLYPTYPSGSGTRYHWGGGFQIGVYYLTGTNWHFGASLKSPQWSEDYRFKTEDELGRPRTVKIGCQYPLIVSLGAAYSGIEDYVFACDVRYFDYAASTGFGDSGFQPDGAVDGLAWRSIWSVNAGVQRRLTDRVFVRLGYSFNENPISDSMSMFNVSTPLILQHTLYLGTSYKMTEQWIFSLSYMHCFENRISGPMVGPLGPIAGTSVTSEVSADVLNAGITVRF